MKSITKRFEDPDVREFVRQIERQRSSSYEKPKLYPQTPDFWYLDYDEGTASVVYCVPYVPVITTMKQMYGWTPGRSGLLADTGFWTNGVAMVKSTRFANSYDRHFHDTYEAKALIKAIQNTKTQAVTQALLYMHHDVHHHPVVELISKSEDSLFFDSRYFDVILTLWPDAEIRTSSQAAFFVADGEMVATVMSFKLSPRGFIALDVLRRKVYEICGC